MGKDFVVGEVRGAGGDDLGEAVRSRPKNPGVVLFPDPDMIPS